MFRKYRLVPSEAAPSAPQLLQTNDDHLVTDPPENPILAPTSVTSSIMPMKESRKESVGIIGTPTYENDMLKKFDGNLTKGRAKLLINFLKKISLQTNENGEILYDDVIGSPLSQMIDFLIRDATTSSPIKQKRPWDLRRFVMFLESKHLELGMNIPLEFLGKGKHQVLQEIMSPPTYLEFEQQSQSRKRNLPKTAPPKMIAGGNAAKKKILKSKASSLSNWRHLF